MIGYFETNVALLASHIIENLKKSKNPIIAPSQIIRDVTEAHKDQFSHYKDGEIFHYRNHSDYFRGFYGELEKYIFPFPKELLKAFKKLKKDGKHFFIVTNSHIGPCQQKLQHFFGEVCTFFFKSEMQL